MILCFYPLLLLFGDKTFASQFEDNVFEQATHIQLTIMAPIKLFSANFSSYQTKERYVWCVTSPINSTITVRRSNINFIDNKISIYDQNYSSLVLSNNLQKFTSSSNSIKFKLMPQENASAPLNYASLNVLNLSVEMTGFCSHERISCGTDDPGLCYLADDDHCDGIWDCPNGGSDEASCSFCEAGHYPCERNTGAVSNFSFYGKCYPATARCDGKRDCFNGGVDELYCTRKTCSLDQQKFLCDSSGYEVARGQCIPLINVCNVVVDCANGVDEASALCIRSELNNSTSPDVARLIAYIVSRHALDDCLGTAMSRLDAQLRTVLTYTISALIGSLLSVCTIGFVCRTQTTANARRMRMSGRRTARFNSPILRMLREEIRRRPPPPTYLEAMNNSLFEEPILVGVPEPPLVEGPLTRDQVISVRERSMKIMDRVDVACSCHLPAPPISEFDTLSLPQASESCSSAIEPENAVVGVRRTIFGRFLEVFRRRGSGYQDYDVAPTDSELTNIPDNEMHPSSSVTVSGRYSVNSTEHHTSISNFTSTNNVEEEEDSDEDANDSLAEEAITTLAQESIDMEDIERRELHTHSPLANPLLAHPRA